MKLGARIFKTGIAIVLALFLARLLDMPSPVFAGIAAIFAIKPSIYRSYLAIVEQIQGNIIGAIVAVVFGLIFNNNYLIVGLAAIITIIIMLRLKLENNISLGLVTMIVILEAPGDDFLHMAWIRFSTLLLGILSSFIVNLIFLPPKYETKLYHRITSVAEDIIKLIRLTSRHATDHDLLKKEIGKLNDRLLKVTQFYTLFNEERSYFKKTNIDKKRKTVVYRQVVAVLQSSFDILKLLHRFENDLKQIPETMREQIQDRLDYLINEHERLLLKIVGKVRTHADSEAANLADVQRNELMDLFLHELDNEDFRCQMQPYHLMRLLAAMVDYQEQLKHLETLIDSFQNFHKDNNEIEIQELDED